MEGKEIIAKPVAPPPTPKNTIELAELRRDRRKEKYEQVWALHKRRRSNRPSEKTASPS